MFEKNSKRLTGRFNRMYLINSIYLTGNTNVINVSEVDRDYENQRIFGNYKIMEPSIRLNIFNIIEYEVIQQPKEVDWDTVPIGQIIGINVPWLIYPNAPEVIDFNVYNDPGNENILYLDETVNNCNRYTYAELAKVNKRQLTIFFPTDPSDPRPNRSVVRMSLPKKVCYLLDKVPNHTREMVY